MSFTVQDMMLISQERYHMKFCGGQNGWSNSISWCHLLEDTTIIQNFWGKELAVTTGLGFPTEDKLLELLRELVNHHAAGLIVNVGNYISEIPQSALAYCDENDFPLLTVPWEVHLADMMKDFSIRIFLQGSADEQITNALICAMEQPDNGEQYRKELLPYFDVDGTFQVVLIAQEGLDEMDTVERQKLSYRIQMYLEDITHNGSFFYYNSYFVLVVNAVPEEFVRKLVEGMMRRATKRMPESPLCVGVGSVVKDVSRLTVSYERASAACRMAMQKEKKVVYFDEMGLQRLLYMARDREMLREMEEECLAPLEEYDRRHHSDYVETLRLYLKHNGSIQAIAGEMFTHRNTVIYRVNNIKKLLGTDLTTPEERLPYQIALLIRDML